jgi:predicted transcriptional regulator
MALSREQSITVRNIFHGMGLDAKEIDVYLTLLSLKSAPVSAIAKASKQPRTSIYFILDKLQEKGFVSEVESGKITHYVAEPPEKLITHTQEMQTRFHRIEQQIHDALPFLHALVSPIATTPKVTLLHGIEGMKKAYREAFSKQFIGFYNPQLMYETFGMTTSEYLFHGKKIPMRGKDLVVDGPTMEKLIADHPPTEDFDYRVLPAGITFHSDAIVYGHHVILFAYDHQQTIVRIENEQIADMVRSWFDAMWKISRPVA